MIRSFKKPNKTAGGISNVRSDANDKQLRLERTGESFFKMRETVKKIFEVALSLAKVGSVAYGGGPSMVPILKAEIVERKKWMDTGDFMDALAISNALPGPLVTKMAAAVGWHGYGIVGMTAALLGMVLPSAVAMLLLAGFVQHIASEPMVASALKGLRPVVVAMLAYAAYDMTPGSLVEHRTISIALIALTLMIYTGIHPALIIVMGAAVGAALKL